MTFDWEYICSRNWSVANVTDEEKDVYNKLRSRDSFARSEVKEILEEYSKCLASKFDGPVSLINSSVVKNTILNSHEYRLNLFPESGK